MNKTVFTCLLLSFTALLCGGRVQAHFPWLASDDKGHAVMWFGDSTNDRTYPMPEKVQAIELHSTHGTAVATRPVQSDALVGIQSEQPIDSNRKISGTTTYGLYHGSKLTYYVEHLPHSNPDAWPSETRPDAPLQTIMRPDGEGGVRVSVLRSGKPLAGTEVKLYCEDGHEEASHQTDEQGVVRFSNQEVEPGLNAIMLGVTDANATGTFDGEGFTSTSDYLTATFLIPKSNARGSRDNQPNVNRANAPEANMPQIDPTSGASVSPSNLPELPEELTSFGAAIAGDKLYIYGGHTGNAHSYSTAEQSDRLWCLDVSAGATGEWQELPGGPSLQGLALVAHQNQIIRIGGFTAVNEFGEEQDLRSRDAVAAFNTETKTWSDLSPLPEARSSFDAAVLGDKVYVFGGWRLEGESDQSKWHQTAWSLDLSVPGAQWQATAEPPFQRRAVSVAAHHGKLFINGGMTAQGKPTTRVDIYDPSSDSWAQGPSLPGSGMSGFGSAAFAAGGELYVSTMDGFVHRLAADEKSWSTIAKSEPARFFHRMLPVGEHALLMVGGANMEIGKFTKIDRIELEQ